MVIAPCLIGNKTEIPESLMKLKHASQKQAFTMKIRSFILGALTVIAIFSCKKDRKQTQDEAGASEMLTAKPWKLLSYGNDDNKDGVVNNNEELIRDCEKDNTAIFNIEGSGMVMENVKICEGHEGTSPFKWSLTNNNTMLDFQYGIAAIVKLSKDSLIITDTGSGAIKLIVKYSH